jgi:hypothetical protein
MAQTHTIVVEFPEGASPRYNASTEFEGGRVVAVNFGGDQLARVQELEDALEALRNDGAWIGNEWVPSGEAQALADAAPKETEQ